MEHEIWKDSTRLPQLIIFGDMCKLSTDTALGEGRANWRHLHPHDVRASYFLPPCLDSSKPSLSERSGQMCHLSGWVMGSKGPFIFWAGSQCGHCEGTMTFMRSGRPQSHPHQGEVSPSRLFHSLLCWVTGPSSDGSSKTTRFKGTPLGEWERTVQPLLRRIPLSQK